MAAIKSFWRWQDSEKPEHPNGVGLTVTILLLGASKTKGHMGA
jgi:hypothetical protein